MGEEERVWERKSRMELPYLLPGRCGGGEGVWGGGHEEKAKKARSYWVSSEGAGHRGKGAWPSSDKKRRAGL